VDDGVLGTRERLLRAAIDDIALHGYAGARVDRISKSASANVERVYSYFGNKEGLFAEVLDRAVGQLGEELGAQHSNLDEFADALFDFVASHPCENRVVMWARLERPSEMLELVGRAQAQPGSPLETLTRFQNEGTMRPEWAAAEVLEVLLHTSVIAMETTDAASARSLVAQVAGSFSTSRSVSRETEEPRPGRGAA
jgi:AcrR family transcriptional regulator